MAQTFVQRQVFTLPTYTTLGGATLRDVKVGWESYGRLAPGADNVVLVCHSFSSNARAAGRLRETDGAPGFWDALIGPGKAIDTSRYFVVSIDSLVNLNSKDGITVTTGPASIDPATGRPYGMRFPVVTIPDFVRVQKALLESLGVRKLRMVAGPSMGALQAFEWAAANPDRVERVLAVVGVPMQIPNAMVELGRWCAPIRLDPHWNGGDYYGGPEPIDGVAHGFMNIFVGARHPEYVEAAFGFRPADPERPPLASVANPFESEAAFWQAARDRAVRTTDANTMLYMTRANQLFVPGLASSVDAGLERIKAKVLFMPSRTDLLFPPAQVRPHYERLKANGNEAYWAVIDTPNGHIGGITDVAGEAGTIRRFLEGGGS